MEAPKRKPIDSDLGIALKNRKTNAQKIEKNEQEYKGLKLEENPLKYIPKYNEGMFKEGVIQMEDANERIRKDQQISRELDEFDKHEQKTIFTRSRLEKQEDEKEMRRNAPSMEYNPKNPYDKYYDFHQDDPTQMEQDFKNLHNSNEYRKTHRMPAGMSKGGVVKEAKNQKYLAQDKQHWRDGKVSQETKHKAFSKALIRKGHRG